MNPAATPERKPFIDRLKPDISSRFSRSFFVVDRDRIVHSETFRALQYKTQVQSLIAPSANGHEFRTRLNHVIEVAQIARNLAVRIGADPTLSEAIALAHDLGHPPFGHAGERALRDSLARYGHNEWNANIHSLSVVDDVESAFIEFRGLNLTWATREGIARHATPFDEPVSFGEFANTANGGFECQVVDAADMLAYLSHDLDDAITSGYLSLEEVAGLAPLFSELIDDGAERWTSTGKGSWPSEERDHLLRRMLIARFVGRSLENLTVATENRLEEFQFQDSTELRESSNRVVTYSESYGQIIESLLNLLIKRYYRSEQVKQADNRAEKLLTELFDALLERMDLVPKRFDQRDKALAVAHYMISLNDHSASELATKLVF